MSKKQQSITSLPQSPDEERHGRMVRYTVSMLIRLVCVVLALVTHGWIQIVAIGGAIVLPYIAVVFANVPVNKGGGAEPYRPGEIVPFTERRE